MKVKTVAMVLFLATAMYIFIAGCSKPVEEADVIGIYVKDNPEPVKFRTSSTEAKLQFTEGKCRMELQEGGKTRFGDQNMELPWKLKDGKVYVYLMNASASGEVKGGKIIGLGGKGIVWVKQ